jgi:hypothetical protein
LFRLFVSTLFQNSYSKSFVFVTGPLRYRYSTVALPLRYRYVTVTAPLRYRYVTVTKLAQQGHVIYRYRFRFRYRYRYNNRFRYRFRYRYRYNNRYRFSHVTVTQRCCNGNVTVPLQKRKINCILNSN